MSAPRTLQAGGVAVHVEGEGGETVLMVHGWPDTYRLWDAQVAALKGRMRCARFSLPGFEPGTPRAAKTMDELVDTLAQVADAVSPGRPLTLLLHDWGCVFGYEYAMRNPGRVARIVGVDIGDGASLRKSLTPGPRLAILAYQVWLAAAWVIGGPAGDWMTRWMARKVRCPSDPAPIGARMDYPYFMAWFGGRLAYPRHLQRFAPSCPLLFIYGRRKPFMFHASAWAERVAAQPGCRVEGFDTGHWVMLEQPERFNAALLEWLGAQLVVAPQPG